MAADSIDRGCIDTFEVEKPHCHTVLMELMEELQLSGSDTVGAKICS